MESPQRRQYKSVGLDVRDVLDAEDGAKGVWLASAVDMVDSITDQRRDIEGEKEVDAVRLREVL